jgi:hypothetical protein
MMAPLGEADTRAKLIDPGLHGCGWTEDLIRREETAGAIDIIDGRPRRQAKGRVDYVLRVRVNSDSQPVAVSLIEAKAESLPPTHGLEQAKLYAACKRLNVPFVFSSNGHMFVEFDVLADLGYGMVPRTRVDRADAFTYKHERWLAALPASTAEALKALTAQFSRVGTDGLENPQVFQIPDVVRAGGFDALRALGRPAEVLRETKERLFAA